MDITTYSEDEKSSDWIPPCWDELRVGVGPGVSVAEMDVQRGDSHDKSWIQDAFAI